MKEEHHLDLPRRLQIEFSGVVQQHTDDEGGEVEPAADVGDLRGGVPRPARPAASRSHEYATATVDGKVEIEATVAYGRRAAHG